MSPQPLRVALLEEPASPPATARGYVDAVDEDENENGATLQVARCLARAGHQVDVFTRRDDPDAPAVVDVRPGLRRLHMTAGPARCVTKQALLAHLPEFSRSMQRLFARSVRYDVVHANGLLSGLAALRLKEGFGMPLVMRLDVRRPPAQDAETFASERIDIERRLVAHADRLVAECAHDKAELMRLYRAPPRAIATVPRGVDTDELAPASRSEARRTLGLANDEFVVLQLGRLAPGKGIDNVIRAIAQLPSAARVRLLVVGGASRAPDERATPEIARLRRLAAQCGVASRITFVGRRRRAELAALYNACDVFVTTPWHQALGITALEAMACGTPVVGSAVGGIASSVVDGVTGYLVAPHDPDALAERLAHLRAHPELARALGRAGLRRVRSRFSLERVAEALIDIYEAVRWRAHETHHANDDRQRLRLVGRAGSRAQEAHA